MEGFGQKILRIVHTLVLPTLFSARKSLHPLLWPVREALFEKGYFLTTKFLASVFTNG